MRYLGLVLRALLPPSGGVAGVSVCKYHPSCSEYASEAFKKYGPVTAALKITWRLLRCNPWSRGGVDHP